MPNSNTILNVPETSYASLPMAADRKIGWDHLRSVGRVVLIDGWYYLTHRDDVLGALRQPELFSSRDAFDILGSPVPLPPLSTDPRGTPATARFCSPCSARALSKKCWNRFGHRRPRSLTLRSNSVIAMRSPRSRSHIRRRFSSRSSGFRRTIETGSSHGKTQSSTSPSVRVSRERT